jgi:hypothetical protein
VFGEGKDYLVALLTLNQDEVEDTPRRIIFLFWDYSDLITKKRLLFLYKSGNYQNGRLPMVEQINEVYHPEGGIQPGA